MKLEKVRSLKGTIYCETGLHIGGSTDVIEIGGLDNPVIKHPITYEPYIPGSSLKGKMRCSLEREKGVQTGAPCGCGDKNCMICRVFGSHSMSGKQLGPTRIIVRDAMLSENSRKQIKEIGSIFSEIKTENLIDRIRGTAGHPRQFERVPAGVEFELDIVLQVYDIDDEQQMIDTIRKGLLWIQNTYLGKGGSRGSGKVLFKDLTLDGQPFNLE